MLFPLCPIQGFLWKFELSTVTKNVINFVDCNSTFSSTALYKSFEALITNGCIYILQWILLCSISTGDKICAIILLTLYRFCTEMTSEAKHFVQILSNALNFLTRLFIRVTWINNLVKTFYSFMITLHRNNYLQQHIFFRKLYSHAEYKYICKRQLVWFLVHRKTLSCAAIF